MPSWVPPTWDWGTAPPPPGWDGVPPTWDWDTPQEGTWSQSPGYPHQKGHEISGSIMEWRWSAPPPQKGHGTSGSTMRWRWGTPCVDRQTDACENITSRRTAYAGGKNYNSGKIQGI